MAMDSSEHPVLRDIVLVGGGHSHVGVLRHFAMHPLPGVRLTLVSSEVYTPYSGMLPGYVAGHYDHDAVHIDLWRLARHCGARFLHDEAVGLDRSLRQVLCSHRPPVHYDLLSINTGAAPRLPATAAGHAVPVKPIHRFNQRWLDLLARARAHTGPLTIAVVGAGAGGVELLLAMQFRLHNELRRLGRDPVLVQMHLFSADADILPTHNTRVRRHFRQVLAQRGVVLHLGSTVQAVAQGSLTTAAGATLPADEVVWATQAGGAAWLQATGLALDGAGFIAVNDCLQSTTDPRIFAAGDVAAMVNHPLEKAGVFAVRQAMPLAGNLRRALVGRALQPYHPQRHWLALISTGDRHAVASRGALAWHGRWVWRWKDSIDRRFMRRYQQFGGMPLPATTAPDTLHLQADEARQARAAEQMRCGGCGAKVGASVLSQALATLPPQRNGDVLLGLDSPDDAAVVRVPPGQATVHTVDFFRAFIDDPYVFGQIAAQHALGDIFAMGADAQTATAIATVPPGLERQVADTLGQMMRGAVEVLNAAGCTLVGGHSGEGRELALGFAINGLVDADLRGLLRKGGMQPGNLLVLTKPLGTGTLLAAHALGQAEGRWVAAALASMVQSSQQAARCLRDHGATACTDVTGFGLLGHLLEMARPAGVDAEIALDALPALSGAADTLAAGVHSSLHPANLRLQAVLDTGASLQAHPLLGLLFDPQTAGGLLASLPAHSATACVRALQALGYGQAAIIGQVLPAGGTSPRIRLVLQPQALP